MGKPRFSRKKYETPSHPWQADRIKAENELVKKYGLKNKKEIWKAKTKLRQYRGQARSLLAKIDTSDPQIKKEIDQLVTHLTRMNMLPLNSNLDDVLAMDSEVILSRRLQTLTYLKGLAHTPKQARQLISHGHIAIGGRRTTIPGYIVTKNEESEIGYVVSSPLNDVMHPARPKSDFPASPAKKTGPVEKPMVKPESIQKEESKVEVPKKTDDKTQVKEEKKPIPLEETKKPAVKPVQTEVKDEKQKQSVAKPETEKKEIAKPPQSENKDQPKEKTDKKEEKEADNKGEK